MKLKAVEKNVLLLQLRIIKVELAKRIVLQLI